MRDFATKLGKQPAEIDEEIERALGIDDASNIAGTRENRALGGTVKDQMKDELQPEARYLGTFAWASQVSHGSVLAINELAKATDGKADDLLSLAAADNMGNALLYNGVWVILKFASLLERDFEIAVPGIQEVTDKTTRINARLKIVTAEQEARTLKMREDQRKKRI